MNNVIRLRPVNTSYSEMSALELLKIFQEWAEEPGEAEIYTQNWLQRGFDLLPALYAVAETDAMKKLSQEWYHTCLNIERAQHGIDAS